MLVNNPQLTKHSIKKKKKWTLHDSVKYLIHILFFFKNHITLKTRLYT